VCGSLPQVPFISETLLNLQIAGPGRQSGFVLAAACVAGAATGMRLIPWMPVFVLAAVLLNFGIGLLSQTIVKGVRTMSSSDYGVAVTVAIVINLWGFVAGVLYGIAAVAVIRACGRLASRDSWRTSPLGLALKA